MQKANDIIVDREISQFSSVGLQQLEGANLQNRMDTKFMIEDHLLKDLLVYMLDSYDIVEIDQLRKFLYKSLYFDTDQFDMYSMHQRGFKKRHKVRIRNYTEAGLFFFEVKKKYKGRTIKERIPITDFASSLTPEMIEFYSSQLDSSTSDLKPRIYSNYERISFVRKDKKERITLDFNLEFVNDQQQFVLPNRVIVELKQEGADRSSPVYSYLKKMGVRPAKMSKYCLGASLLNPHLKRNKLKRALSLFSQTNTFSNHTKKP